MRPTAKQQRYLRDLANRTGTTFTPPRTAAEAHREIDRLLEIRSTSRIERALDTDHVRSDLARRAHDATAVRPSEISGYGSSARWAHSDRETAQ